MHRLAPSLVLALAASCAQCQPAWQVVRPIAGFDRFDLVLPDQEYAVRKAGELRVEGECSSGGAECDMDVPETGWYELLAEPEGGLNEFVVDGRLSLFAGDGRKEGGEAFGKVDNVWLEQGRHTIRVQRMIWWGFWPALRAIALRRSDGTLPRGIRVEYAQGPGEAVVPKGGALRFTVHSGGLAEAAGLTAQLRDAQTDEVVATATVRLQAGAEAQTTEGALRCPREGAFKVRFLAGAQLISTRDLPAMGVHVVDTTPVAHSGGELQKTLLQEIDCATQGPDYTSGGETQVVTRGFGAYRLSGDSGFLHAQHHNVPESWFAYKLATPDVGKPHLLEVDYPDDDNRTFLITIRGTSKDDYPVASGVDSGGPWSLSGTMQTQTLLFWPKSDSPRVAFMACHNGVRAAAARIRLYRVEGDIPPLDVPPGGRTFANWYEEGSNFAGFYGGQKGGTEDYRKSAEMWVRELAYMGGNLIMPTVSVYQMNLYPSRYNNSFAEMTSPDIARLLLLECEKHGSRLAAEFHPEVRELEYPYPERERRTNALVSKTGQVAGYGKGTPVHHPLHPRNQEWYLGMIGEFADRYKDSPALAGVSLRCMSWANPALNNFHSLDWGYDDLTVGMFERETGTDVPVPPRDPERFAKRHDWLMANAKGKWTAWRCDKITDLFRRIVARVREARPDLRVYATVFDLGPEAGLDPAKLSRMDGLVLVNCKHSYGRRALTYEGHLADQKNRDSLLDPAVLNSLHSDGEPGAFMFGAGYFEATEKILKPAEIGLPADTKATWISGVANPAGRHYLERYAVALAETDAQMLGDGGNAYTLGQPLLREFTREYRALPDVAFEHRPDATDPVAMWQLARPEGLLFYAVNREGYPVRVTMPLEPAGTVRRLSTGEEVNVKDGRLELELQPYQLLTFRADAGVRISGVTETPPAEARARVEAMVGTLADLSGRVAAGKVALSDEGKRLLEDSLAEARQALAEGRLWRARTLLENHALARDVYNPALTFPSGLGYLIDPRTARLVRARSLPRPEAPVLHLSFETLTGGAISAVTPPGLTAKCEGACELREGRSGKALHLDGQTARLELPAGTVALPGGGFTLAAWVKAEPGGTSRMGIVQEQAWPAGIALLLWNGSIVAEGGTAQGSTPCRTGDGLVSPGAWHHVAAVFEPGKAITVYLDGDAVQRTELNGGIALPDTPLLIGWNGWGGAQNDPSPGPFTGLLDDVKAWDRPLSADEVLAEAAGEG